MLVGGVRAAIYGQGRSDGADEVCQRGDGVQAETMGGSRRRGVKEDGEGSGAMRSVTPFYTGWMSTAPVLKICRRWIDCILDFAAVRHSDPSCPTDMRRHRCAKRWQARIY